MHIQPPWHAPWRLLFICAGGVFWGLPRPDLGPPEDRGERTGNSRAGPREDDLRGKRMDPSPTLQRKRETQRGIKLCALCGLCVKHKNSLIFYLTQRAQRTQKSKANCAAAGVVAGYARQENAEGNRNEDNDGNENYPPPPSLCSSSHLSQGDS